MVVVRHRQRICRRPKAVAKVVAAVSRAKVSIINNNSPKIRQHRHRRHHNPGRKVRHAYDHIWHKYGVVYGEVTAKNTVIRNHRPGHHNQY
jgi:hypothetical protein